MSWSFAKNIISGALVVVFASCSSSLLSSQVVEPPSILGTDNVGQSIEITGLAVQKDGKAWLVYQDKRVALVGQSWPPKMLGRPVTVRGLLESDGTPQPDTRYRLREPAWTPPPSMGTPPPKYDGTLPEPPEEIRCRPNGRHSLCYLKIPGGTFTMGSQATDPSAPSYDPDAFEDESPPHQVTLASFWILAIEVTASLYNDCLVDAYCQVEAIDADGGFSNYSHAKNSKQPANSITWSGARTVCGYFGGRLPTEAEWEYAARGEQGRRFPWGNGARCPILNFARADGKCESLGTLAPSHLDTRHPQGLIAMSGNVWEWVEDRYGADYYAESPVRDPRGPSEGSRRVQRGGGWTSYDPLDLRSSARMSMGPDQKVNDVGARCV